MSSAAIHHLDCGTMCPRAAGYVGLVDERGGELVAHCLLIEGDDGLVLIDTGYGTGDGWLLHCGDAYLHREEVAAPPACSRPRRVYHRLNSHDAAARRTNADRLSDLARDHGDEVTLFCSHDPVEFAHFA